MRRIWALLPIAVFVVACQATSIAGTYECRGTTELPSPRPAVDPVWIWELHEDGSLTVTDPAETVFEGTWSVDGDAGTATVEGDDNQFTIESDQLVFETGTCFRRD